MCCESWWYCWQFNRCVAMTTLHPSKRTSKILVSPIKTAVHHEAAQWHNATVGAGDQVMNVVGVGEM